MEHYVGLDVSLKLTANLHRRPDRKDRARRDGCIQPGDNRGIHHAPRVARIGLETGPTSTWLRTELNKLGCPSSASMPGMRRRL
jgi:transposase